MVSGIYQITCAGKAYVGQAQNIRQRFFEHKSLLRRGVHFNPHLQHAWNKHGEENFSFEPLIFVPLGELTCYEQVAINSLSPQHRFNIGLEAVHASRGVKRTAEARAKMSLAQQKRMSDPEQRRKVSESLRGKVQPLEVCQKRSLALKGRIFSVETRRKLSLAKMGNKGRSGQPMSEATKKKISEAKRIRDRLNCVSLPSPS